MIEAPQSQEARPRATGAPPNGPSKASMMIAAYRAARLNQRLTLRATSLPQQHHMPSAEPPLAMPQPAPTEAVALSRTDTFTAAAEPAALSQSEPSVALAKPAPSPSPAHGEPALAKIGLGPSMLLRLNQIGVKSVHDVAQANPADLRAALGSSSRLLNVEAWISSARHLAATGYAA